jgi:hypothetical protein
MSVLSGLFRFLSLRGGRAVLAERATFLSLRSYYTAVMNSDESTAWRVLKYLGVL